APEQRITLEQALRAQTINSAEQLFSEHEIGSITPGKLADLVVLGRSPRAAGAGSDVAAGVIAGIPVLETILGGQTVYRADA
ncbi:MAG: amidohydrolase family protein, partial [Microterricola sp.]